MTPKEHLASLPRKTVASGALILDNDGRILIVKPTYKDGWLIPGGSVEESESPRVGCEREIFEEIGLKISVGRLLVVDHRFVAGERDALHFIFDGGTLSEKDITKIKLASGELSEFRFVIPSEAKKLLRPKLGKRISESLKVLTGDECAYLEDGNRI